MTRMPATADDAGASPVNAEQLLEAIGQVQTGFTPSTDPREIHALWLEKFLALTDSECGFSAEIVKDPQAADRSRIRAVAKRSGQGHAATLIRVPVRDPSEFEAHLSDWIDRPAPTKNDLERLAQVFGDVPVSAFVIAPMRWMGETIGVVAIANRPAGYEPGVVRSLEPLLGTCAGLIEAGRSARLLDVQHRATQQLAHERAVLERLARMDPLESVLEALVLGHDSLFPGTLGSVLLLDDEGRHLLRGAAPSLPEEYTQAIHGLEIGPLAGSCGTAAHLRETVIVSDIRSDPRWEQGRELAERFSLGACWSTPIISGSGQVLGTFAQYYREPRAPEPHELTAIESSARIARLAIERKRAEVSLQSFAERLDLATRSAQMGIFDYDIKGGRLMWDEQMLAIYGVRREDFKQSYEGWRERVHPDDLPAAEEGVNSSIEGSRPFEASFRIIRPDGKTRFIEAATIMQRDAGGRATRMTGVNIDVTVKKQLEAQVLRSQRLESVGRLAGGLAHDLNNLLAPMLIGPSILREMVDSRDGKNLLDTIESSAQRAADIIRQLLTFSRGTEGQRAPVDCGAIVDDMLHIIRETFPRSIKARRSGSTAPWTVIGDATQLHQVLMNLCVNSRDEMPGGGTLDLRLENVEVDAALARMHPGARAGRYVVLSVTDDGRGIDPQHMDRLFEPFFTTKGVGQGTGLGLATVLGIVKTHGGFIQVQSQLGRGSEFRIHLPASTSDVAAQEAPSNDRFPRGHGELVMIVDDEGSIRRVTRAMLERNGYRVLLATSGEEALAIHREQQGQLKLILSDLMMPGMDGESLVRAIRAADPRVKLIVMSGDVDANGQNSAISSLVHGLLEKPFTMETMLRRFNEALTSKT